VRASIVVAVTVPIAVLMSFIAMKLCGVCAQRRMRNGRPGKVCLTGTTATNKRILAIQVVFRDKPRARLFLKMTNILIK
jgi:hypothetical protein